MIPEEITKEAMDAGFNSVEELTLMSGETVYLLQSSGATGLPMYLHYVDGILMLSTREESLALFSEPEYMRDDNG